MQLSDGNHRTSVQCGGQWHKAGRKSTTHNLEEVISNALSRQVGREEVMQRLSCGGLQATVASPIEMLCNVEK